MTIHRRISSYSHESAKNIAWRFFQSNKQQPDSVSSPIKPHPEEVHDCYPNGYHDSRAQIALWLYMFFRHPFVCSYPADVDDMSRQNP
jgi:hypothetical protein